MLMLTQFLLVAVLSFLFSQSVPAMGMPLDMDVSRDAGGVGYEYPRIHR
jgi:hypothetical protein